MRPHLDYGDLLYHRYDPEMRLGFTQKLEPTQQLFLVHGKVQIGKGFTMSWDGNPFTVEDGIVAYVIFST